MSAGATATVATVDVIGRVLDVFGYGDDERVSVLVKRGSSPPSGYRLTPPELLNLAAGDLSGAQLWFSVSVVRDGPGRGGAADVVRAPGLWADLDVKPGGLPDWQTADAVVETLGDLLGTAPAVVVNSGHGLQPRWLIDAEDSTDTARMAALARRFGALTRFVCHRYGGSADSVFDLPRVLRAPGTWNLKDPAAPVPTSATFPGGRPLSAAEVADVCDACGVPEAADLGDGEVRAPAGGWKWAPVTCGYVRRMVAGWATDNGEGPRHPWLVSCAVRLAAAHRHGCITEADHAAALATLTKRTETLCRRPGDSRAFDAAEVTEAVEWGVLRVETFTAEGCAGELGDHSHTGDAAEVAAWFDAVAGDGDATAGQETAGDGGPADPEGWEPLARIDRAEAPPFSVEALPEPVRGFVSLVAARVQIDPVIPAVMALGSLAALAQKTARVQGPGWSEQLSLFVLALADVSERKSPACAAVTRPLADVEADLAERTADARRFHNEARAIAEGRLKEARAEAVRPRKGKPQPGAAEVAALAADLDALGPPMHPPRLRVDNVTTERLRGIMADNGGRAAVISPELSFLSILEGSYTTRGEADLSAVLSAYSGGEPIITDRQGRDGERIDHPALTVVAVGQPERLADLASVKGAEDRGLVARFVLARARRLAGARIYDTAAVDLPAMADTAPGRAWAELLAALGCREPSDTPPMLHLDGPALDRFATFARDVEADLGTGGRWEPIRGFAGKAHGLALRFAGLLHLAEHPDAGDGDRIADATVAAAVELARWALVAHREALTGARIPLPIRRALRVLKAAELGTLTGKRTDPQPWAPFAVRDVQRQLSGPAEPLTAADARAVVELLADHGYCRATSPTAPVRFEWRPGLAEVLA